MAITKLKIEPYVQTSEYGYTSVNHHWVSAGGSIPMYIPIFMPNISNGTPSYQKVLTEGSLIYANDKSCMPSSESIIQTQNYVSPKLENNNSFANIVTEEDPTVYRGTRFTCHFVNRNLQNITFTTAQ